MEDISKKLNESLKQDKPSEPIKQAMVKRYMIEITSYPNGTEYIRSWCVGKNILTKKVKKMAEVSNIELQDEEVH